MLYIERFDIVLAIVIGFKFSWKSQFLLCSGSAEKILISSDFDSVFKCLLDEKHYVGFNLCSKNFDKIYIYLYIYNQNQSPVTIWIRNSVILMVRFWRKNKFPVQYTPTRTGWTGTGLFVGKYKYAFRLLTKEKLVSSLKKKKKCWMQNTGGHKVCLYVKQWDYDIVHKRKRVAFINKRVCKLSIATKIAFFRS